MKKAVVNNLKLGKLADLEFKFTFSSSIKFECNKKPIIPDARSTRTNCLQRTMSFPRDETVLCAKEVCGATFRSSKENYLATCTLVPTDESISI